MPIPIEFNRKKHVLLLEEGSTTNVYECLQERGSRLIRRVYHRGAKAMPPPAPPRAPKGRVGIFGLHDTIDLHGNQARLDKQEQEGKRPKLGTARPAGLADRLRPPPSRR